MISVGGQPESAIRKIDIKAYIERTDSGVQDCVGQSRPKVDIEFLKYADVDNDGIEEIIIVGRTCFSGTGGPDFYRVYKLVGENQLKDISPSDPIHYFKGEPIFPRDGNWIVSLDFVDGYLVRSHTDSRYNNGTIEPKETYSVKKYLTTISANFAT